MGFPFQIKTACAILDKIDYRNSTFDFDEFFQTIYFNEIKEYFNDLFNALDNDHQKLLKHFLARGKVPDQLSFLLGDLVRKNYINMENNKPVLYSPVFEKFTAQKFNLSFKRSGSKVSLYKKIINWFSK